MRETKKPFRRSFGFIGTPLKLGIVSTIIGLGQPSLAARAELPSDSRQVSMGQLSLDATGLARPQGQVFELHQKLVSVLGRDLDSAELEGLQTFAAVSSAYQVQRNAELRSAALGRNTVEGKETTSVQGLVICFGVKTGLVVTLRGFTCVSNSIESFFIWGHGIGPAVGLSGGWHIGFVRAEPGEVIDGDYDGLTGGNINTGYQSMSVLGFKMLITVKPLIGALVGPDLLYMEKQNGKVQIGLFGVHAGPSAELVSRLKLKVSSAL